MNIQRFRHFLAVAEEGSFAKAALRLGMSQPPLSQSIRRMERELGVKLFDRTTQKVSLTKAGEAFYPEARITVAAAARAIELAKSTENTAPVLRIGFVSLALFEVLPVVLHQAAELGLAVQVSYASTNEQIAALAEGRLDLGFVTPPHDSVPRLQSSLISDENLLLAIPEDLQFSDEDTTDLAALSDRLIMFPRTAGPKLHDALLDMFRSKGLTPQIVAEAPADMLVTLAMVAAGVGVSFVPAAVARSLSVEGVRFHRVPEPDLTPTWPIALIHMPLSSGSPEARLAASLKRSWQ